ncbi:T9SS type A sorting domain-containing protein [candidate division WOR-3 bacterium]|uniref:T9SS type A sorting domain-containing protein n=1 Tax=candidate division WOR-3 bacterium TaxID=2052148 RepID=A0A938BR78_UNCW3|nr:T9SS type A sorting domain-containing protein [candidate division WOR-3 bacterium]
MKRMIVATILASVALCTSALGYYAWQWTWEGPNDCMFDLNGVSDYWLTKNNGTPAVAMSYANWTSVGVECRKALTRDPWWSYDSLLAFEYTGSARWDGQHNGREWPYVVWDKDYKPGDPYVVMNDSWKLWMCSEYHNQDYKCRTAWDKLDEQSPIDEALTQSNHVNYDHCLAGTYLTSDGRRMVAAFSDNYQNSGPNWGLLACTTTNRGSSWYGSKEVSPYQYEVDQPKAPSLAVTNYSGADYLVHCAYQLGENTPSPEIRFKTASGPYGGTWGSGTGTWLGDGVRPCIVAAGRFMFVCWHDDNRIVYKFSRNAAESWYGPYEIPTAETRVCDHTSAAVVTYGTNPDTAVLLVSQMSSTTLPVNTGFVFQMFGVLVKDENPHIAWQLPVRLSAVDTKYPTELRPSVVTQGSIGRWVYNTTIPGGDKRGVYLRSGKVGWVNESGFWYDDAVIAGSGRLIARAPDGSIQYASVIRPQVVAGPAEPDLPPMVVAPGSRPGMALDGDGEQWIAYVCDDTVWTKTGDGSYEVVYAGSSSAVPGQPSIVCYPNQASGVYVGSVVFPVYDTAGAASKIMYARVDTGGVVLDTIESVANLGDSLPCVSVYQSDTLVVTWQHGDSTLASMLCDYGPGTSGQVPAWSSPNLVTANGYHAMSRFDDNGTALNVVWTRKNGSNYAIQRATCDLSTSLFGNWSQMATPGDTGSAEKTNPVFAGLGVSCWQEKDANGKWTIKGFVRGEEETFVANDTNACYPHTVAESSAISPSIDQVRVHLLYTAGVAFEVDSGVYDTGETRYVCESLNVSRATSDATKYNNGAKLVRKNGSDSLFSVYADLDNAIVFAWSANGDTWQRSVLASGRDYPTIAEDSSGKRWVVVRKPSQTLNPPIQEAYYRNGSSWTGPETLYSVSGTTLGPASLSGSSYTQSGIAYAAFLSTATGGTQSLILAKFNGSSVSTYTVATGSSLGDPSITVEPYKSDSDRIHVTWEDNGTIKYRMDTDGRSTSIANNWTAVHDLTGRGIVAAHPYTNSDADQIVVAWAQGDTTDVYCRKRSTDSAYNNWEIAANLSNTSSKASDYPTIAMGDTVIVAWAETRSGGSDSDILACIDFGDTLNIADNATFSTYPHVLFQNKASGDTAIPYLHTIWSETPEANYYEVGYNKLNLKQASGEGGQSANSVPIPVKPSLASCRPNPLKSHTQISYALPTASNVSLQVYDVTGRTVRTLASGHQQAGNYSVSWDAKDSRGRQVPRGVYFYRLDTPGFRAVKKAVVAR